MKCKNTANKDVWKKLRYLLLVLLLAGGLPPAVADTQGQKLVNAASIERVERSGRIVVLNGVRHYIATASSVHDDAQMGDLRAGGWLRWAEPEGRYDGMLQIDHWELVGTL